MDDERRKSPRMKNSGIVKDTYLIIEVNGKEQKLECEVIDISQHGIKGFINNPGDFRYNIEINTEIPVRVIFNNDSILNLNARIVWYKDSNGVFTIGLHFVGSIW